MGKDGFYSTGRGGAGNIARGVTPEPKEGSPGEDYPRIRQHYFTTGRGGAGNMRENRDEYETRLAQDVEADDRIIEPSKSNPSFGRGGYGNVQAARKVEKKTLLDRAKAIFRNEPAPRPSPSRSESSNSVKQQTSHGSQNSQRSQSAHKTPATESSHQGTKQASKPATPVSQAAAQSATPPAPST